MFTKINTLDVFSVTESEVGCDMTACSDTKVRVRARSLERGTVP